MIIHGAPTSDSTLTSGESVLTSGSTSTFPAPKVLENSVHLSLEGTLPGRGYGQYRYDRQTHLR